MKHRTSAHSWFVLLVLGTTGSSASCLADAPFSIQVLANLSGGTVAYVSGINNAGAAVGGAGGGSSVCPNQCAIIWRDSTTSLLGSVVGAFATDAVAVINAGQVVGNLFMSSYDQSTAVIWNNGTPSLLPSPSQTYVGSGASSINDAGQVAGSAFESESSNNESVPVVWTGSTPSVLGSLPDFTRGSASGINSNGLVVGTLWYTAVYRRPPFGTAPPRRSCRSSSRARALLRPAKHSPPIARV
jgi:uncharacterized membrane protein